MIKSRRLRAIVRFSTTLVIVATLWVWQRVTVVKMIHANDLLRTRVQARSETLEKVAAEVTLLRHRSRIEKIAVEQLGLGPTRPAQRRLIPRVEIPVQKGQDDGWQKLNNSVKKLRALQALKSP